MTDNTHHPAVNGKTVMSTKPMPENPMIKEEASEPKAALFWRAWWVFLTVVALGLLCWQWVDTRLQLSEMQEALARAAAEQDSASKEVLRQAQDQVLALQGRLTMLEAQVDEAKSQQTTLENIYQEVARSRDEWVLIDIEQGVTLAAQQLQIAGNVQGAMLALQAADARLAGSYRPQFFSLRRVLAQDLARLRALPVVDLPGISLRLEGIIAAIDTLPLANDARLKADSQTVTRISPTSSLASLSLTNLWSTLQRLAAESWAEVRGLIRVQRFDREEPPLMAPGQAFFLRENLKLRLLNARLALLAHDQLTFRSELKQARLWIERYFDLRNADVLSAQGELGQLSVNEIDLELPTLNASLSAIRGFKAGKERK
jgi:uroporphyrin-3 C-methyltransferase